MSLFRTSLSVLATELVIVPMGFVTSVLLARGLSTDDRGYYALAIALAFVAIELSQLGWASSSIYQLRRRSLPPERVVGIGLIAVALISALVVSIALAFRPFIIERFLSQTPAIVFPLLLALVPAELLVRVFRGLARGIDRFDLHNASRVFSTVGALVGLAFVFGALRGGLVEALAAFVAVHCLAALGLAVAVSRQTGVRLRAPLSEFWESARFGLKSWGVALSGRVHEGVDVLMLGALLGDPAQVAIYAIAVGIVDRLHVVPESLAVSVYPQLASLDAQTGRELTSAVLRHATTWVLLLLVGLAVVVPPLIAPIWGADYAASVSPFLVLLPAVALLTASRIVARYFMAVDRHQVILGVQAVAVALNVGLNLWLIPRYGGVGAAMASLISYSLAGLASLTLFLRASGGRLRGVLVLSGDDLEIYTTRLRTALRRLGLQR